MGCCFHFLVFSFDMGFIAHRLYAYKRIFQVSRDQEKRMRKFFIDKYTSYSLFFFICHCSIYLICLGIIFSLHLCGIEVIFIVLISLFSCALRVWFFLFLIFICDFICCLLQEFDFLFTAFFVGMLFSFSRLFIRSRFLCPTFISV